MQDIVQQFRLSGTPTEITPFGSGHINDSFRVKTDGTTDYLLQRINHKVFPDVAGMMRNIDRVTRHLRANMVDGQQTLTVIPTQEDQLFLRNGDACWRVYEFLDDLHAYELLDTPEQAYEGGRAYGHFLAMLADFPAADLSVVIPDFHQVTTRLVALEIANKADALGRGRRCKEVVKSIVGLADRMQQIQLSWEAGQLTTRVTHNDTKFNNLLFDGQDRACCVVDLDTVMPGVVHFDFGDAVRTGTATANEEEIDLEVVHLDLEKYRGFSSGYLGVTRDLLSPTERKLLPLAGPLLAYLMAVRFLTGYLEGDNYHKIAYPEHNLNRARNQLRLTQAFLEREADLAKIIRRA
jgi:Ser/Thr protein kinase RdoA (MazF antagonist)